MCVSHSTAFLSLSVQETVSSHTILRFLNLAATVSHCVDSLETYQCTAVQWLKNTAVDVT